MSNIVEFAIEESDRKSTDIITFANEVSSREVISRYTVAMNENLILWMRKTGGHIRSDKAKKALLDILFQETIHDHSDSLLKFAKLSGATPEDRHAKHIEKEILEINKLFDDPDHSGLNGLILCLVLDTVASKFIPDLQKRSTSLGCNEFTYTCEYGTFDIVRNTALQEAVVAEINTYDTDVRKNVRYVYKLVLLLYKKIYDQ